MKKSLLAFFLIVSGHLFCNIKSDSGSSSGNYYLKLNYHNKIELGEYVRGSAGMKTILETDLSHLTKAMLVDCFDLKDQKEEVLMYLHCWLGNERIFHSISLESLNDASQNDKSSAIKKTISIIWKPQIAGYASNWDQAFAKGQKLSTAFYWISQTCNGGLSVFCHSMGNRVFEGILSDLNVNKRDICFNEVVLAAADVDADIFEKEFQSLGTSAKRVHIFTHQKDRLLYLSSKRLHKNRLGLQGPVERKTLLEKNSNFFIVEVGRTTKWQQLDPSNHVYFLRNREVESYLIDVFNHQTKDPINLQEIVLQPAP